jgi:tetratricopeptide (TPR) repeat protein
MVTLGEKHTDYAQALNNLGILLKEIGDVDDALLMQQQAYDIQTATFGPTHPDVATSLHNLASVYAAKGK